MKIKILAVFTIFSVISVLCQAQDIKYVSYFPVPFALHEQINVKTLAILGSRGGAKISAGSETKITGVFTADEEFVAVGDMTVTSHENSNPTINESPVDLVADGLAGQTSSNPEYDGSIGSLGKIEIVSFKGSGVHSVVANNNAVITGMKWGSLGGIGLNGSGGVNWPSECSGGNFSKGLTWVQLKLQGSNEYKTYLTCAGTSGGGPSGGSCTFSGWVQVASAGTSTCGSNPVAGCVEYALCSTIGQPCNTSLQPKTEVVVVSDTCGGGWYLLSGCSEHCSGPNIDPDSTCVGSVSVNCPSSNVCASLGTTGSCISKVITSTCGPYETKTTYQDYSPGCDANCREDLFYCSSRNSTVEKTTCIQSAGTTYYKRTCN